MSGSQALFQAALRLYSSQVVREWRNLASRPLLGLWPSTGPDGIASRDVTDRASEAAQGRAWIWRQHRGEIDIDPGGGRLFHRRRKLNLPAALAPEASRGTSDLTAYLGGRIIPREPALVLFADADHSFAAFCTRLLPRFFALDLFGLPPNTLLMVTLNMGRQLWFQHAIADGVFRHRPVELFRPASMIRTQQLDEISLPPVAPAALALMRERLASLYLCEALPAPRPLLVATAAATRAPELLDRFRAVRPEMAGENFRILDPGLHSLRDLTRAVASAPFVLAPETGELTAVLLAHYPGQAGFVVGPNSRHAALIADRTGMPITVVP